MTGNVMIIITGAPATGKTTLSNELAKKYGLPKINKDEIKELLFKSLEVKDSKWTAQLGIASFELTYFFAEKLGETGKVFIVEGNFDNKYASNIFNSIKSKYMYKVVQLYCYANCEILYERFINRNLSGNRHPGHIRDINGIDDFKNKIINRNFKVDIENSINLDIDTTDFAEVDFQEIFQVVDINIK